MRTGLGLCKGSTGRTLRFLLCIPVRTDLHDGDSRHCVTMHDGVEDGCWTSPPRQQARVNVQNAAAQTHRQFKMSRLMLTIWSGLHPAAVHSIQH